MTWLLNLEISPQINLKGDIKQYWAQIIWYSFAFFYSVKRWYNNEAKVLETCEHEQQWKLKYESNNKSSHFLCLLRTTLFHLPYFTQPIQLCQLCFVIFFSFFGVISWARGSSYAKHQTHTTAGTRAAALTTLDA